LSHFLGGQVSIPLLSLCGSDTALKFNQKYLHLWSKCTNIQTEMVDVLDMTSLQ